MWNQRLEQHAAKMRLRAARLAERMARASTSKVVNPEEVARRYRQMHAARMKKLRTYTDEQKAILTKHGIHTSRAAKELGWSEKRVINAALFLEIIPRSEIEARKGRKGRPPGPPKPKPEPKPHPTQYTPKFVPTPEIDELLKSGKPTAELVKETGWTRHAIYYRMDKLNIPRSSTHIKYQATPEIDEVMREYPRQLNAVSMIVGWPTWAVQRRMDELKLVNPNSRRRNDEQEIVDLLRQHQGCMADVRRALQKQGKRRTEKFIQTIRDKHGIVNTKPRNLPSTKGSTRALDAYIHSLLELSVRRRNEYLKAAFAVLPPVLSHVQISNLMNTSRKTIDNYVNQGWLPVAKKDLIQFIIDQCDYADLSAVQINGHQAMSASNAS